MSILTDDQRRDMDGVRLLLGIYARDFRICCGIVNRKDWIDTLQSENWRYFQEPLQREFLSDCPRVPADKFQFGVN